MHLYCSTPLRDCQLCEIEVLNVLVVAGFLSWYIQCLVSTHSFSLWQVVLGYLVGCLYINFSLLWDPLIEVIG